MKLKAWQKNLLSALTIAVGGIVLFNGAFLLAAAINLGCSWIVALLSKKADFALNPLFWGGIFVLIVLCASWFVFKSKLGPLIKATYLTMPLMVLLVFTGIQFYEQPKWVPICIGAVIVGGVLCYLYKKKLPWQYYFASLYTGALALIVVLADIEL